MTDPINANQPEAHPRPWAALPADKADLFEGADMWFFNDANGEEVFYGCAMSIAVRDLILEAVNSPALLSKLRAPVAGEAVAWANWKVGTESYVPFRTQEEAQASVDRSAIAATQEGPYEVVALYAAPQASEAVRLRRIARPIGSIFVHGDFKAETANERELEKLLRENGTFWESLEQFDAALSAQPGAQKENSDAD